MITYLLHVSAKILLIIWGLGFFLFGVGVIIHVLLILAVLSLISRYFISYKPINKTAKIKHLELLKKNI